MENEEALCGRVKSTGFLTCGLAWAPLSLRNGESKLHQPLVLQIQKLMHVWVGESEFCGASFIYYFFCQVSRRWGKGKPEVLFHCLLKAVSHRQAQDCFSALILTILHPFALFKTILFLKCFIVFLNSYRKSRKTNVWTWSLDRLPLRLYASNQQQMGNVQPKCKVNQLKDPDTGV